MSVRQDFVDSYIQNFACAAEFADGLLRQVEIAYADQENRQLQDHLDQAAVEHMQSQDMLALRKQLDELKTWEARARGASMQIAELLGRPDVLPLLQAGRYVQALSVLHERQHRE